LERCEEFPLVLVKQRKVRREEAGPCLYKKTTTGFLPVQNKNFFSAGPQESSSSFFFFLKHPVTPLRKGVLVSKSSANPCF